MLLELKSHKMLLLCLLVMMFALNLVSNHDINHHHQEYKRLNYKNSNLKKKEESVSKSVVADWRARTQDQVTKSSFDTLKRSSSSRGKWNGRQLNLPNVSFAASNLMRMRKNFSCKKPRPRVVQVKDYYHTFDKTYVPGCTVLYKCDDEAGCCENDAFTCAAKMQEAVTVYFYVLYHNETRYNSVEQLVFTNDTECECREIIPHPRILDIEEPERREEERSGERREEEGNERQQISSSAASFAPSRELELTPVLSPPIVTTQVSPRIETNDKPLMTPIETIEPKKVTIVVESQKKNVNNVEDESALFSSLKKTKQACDHVRCPEPFQAQKDDLDTRRCICGCDHGHESDPETRTRCLSIQKGLHRLGRREARCVSQQVCHEPHCLYHGYYDTIHRICRKNEDEKKNIFNSRFHHSQRD